MPLRGLDQNLRDNLLSVLDQDYPGHRRYVFVVDSDTDPAYSVVNEILNHVNVDALVIINKSGRGKGDALAAGLSRAVGDVAVFVDSDAYVHRHWLRNLITHLLNGSGASTTYRFYLPLRHLNLGTLLRASFNMIGFTAMQNSTARFTWGGSSAVWSWLINKYSIHYYLPHYLSDDYVVTHFVHKEGLPIAFTPESLVLTYEDADIKEAFSWAVRQLWYVRVYGFNGFLLYAVSYTLYVITLPLAITLFLLSLNPWFLLLGLLPFLFGVIKDYIRINSIRGLDEFYRERISKGFVILLAFTSIINVYFSWLVIIKTMFTRSINWRGRVFTIDDAIKLMREKPLR
jgi:cellulose synthase/poly-beta-1,6-N-acetylglucosamine synthase-like glycosyltransferase